MNLELTAIDKAFAKHFLGEDARDDCLSFLSYLLASARSGHLCVQEDEQGLLPHPKEIWPEADWQDESLMKCLKSGLQNLPKRLISPSLLTPLYCDGHSIYLQKNWILETQAIHLFHQLLDSRPDKEIDMQKVEEALKRHVSESILTAEQAQVIKAGCQSCLTLIAGGPGTGKTYTAGHLISLLNQSGQPLEIALAAPTGKAAARLQNSIQAASRHPVKLKAKTLHSLLEVKKYRENEEFTLSADIVLIDECSMIDIKMMVKLLSSLKKGARLILLGDPCQLPPVELGNLFADFVSYLRKNKGERFTELTGCLRVENSDLIALAQLVNQGECQAALHFVKNLKGSCLDIYFKNESVNELVDIIHARFATLEEQLINIDDLSALRLFEKFRVLCPLRGGPLGVDLLNREIDLARTSQSIRYIPIILNRHAKDFDLFNGDTGLLVRGKEKEAYALFEKKGEESVMKIPACLLPSFDLAYCLSVHKCQGSEYEGVFLVLPNGSQVFGRQALYTAITRAKRKLAIWSAPEVFQQMVEQKYARLSGFERRFHHLIS